MTMIADYQNHWERLETSPSMTGDAPFARGMDRGVNEDLYFIHGSVYLSRKWYEAGTWRYIWFKLIQSN